MSGKKILGQTMKNQTSVSINTQGLKEGIYIVQLVAADRREQIRFIKAK
jgi:hypothetical protein